MLPYLAKLAEESDKILLCTVVGQVTNKQLLGITHTALNISNRIG
jgi:hypothetical protein